MEDKYLLKRPDSYKTKKRVGRGPSSGHGKTSCRGHKGQLCRSGSKKRVWFEGGQMPLQRRVPKRGFHNKFKTDYQIINLTDLIRVDADEINPKLLEEKGIIKKADKRVKILGNGEINRSVSVIANAFSNSAIEAIEKAGGKAIIKTFGEKE